MRTAAVLELYDSDTHKVAEALGISRQAVEKWGDIVPELSARRLHEIHGDELALVPAHYQKKRKSA